MKYYFLLAVFLLGAVSQVHGQYNSSFENWHNVGGWYDNPDYWATNNTQLFVPVVKDSVNPLVGKYSMRVLSGGVATSVKYKTIQENPVCHYYYRCNISAGDTVVVMVILSQHGNDNDTEKENHTNASSGWQGAYIGPRSATRDSIYVLVIGGKDSATTFNIDNATITYESVPNLTARLQPRLFRNPMHQHATLHINNSEHTAYRWILNDAIGRTVAMQRNLTGEVITIDRNNLPPGFYCWQLWDERDGGRAAGQLVME